MPVSYGPGSTLFSALISIADIDFVFGLEYEFARIRYFLEPSRCEEDLR